jgi:hypothetical protein
VNDTLSTPDPAMQVAEIGHIIQHRGIASCEATLLKIRAVVYPPADPPDMRPIATDEHGWPMLNAEGTAWERHDDPRADE